MNLLQSVVLMLYVCLSTCMPKDEALNEVAGYIEFLHSLGNHHTIFSLFGVDRNAKEGILSKAQSRLLKECYALKKGAENRFGKNVTPTEAKRLVVNGYKILTDTKLREAYDWILDKAPVEFMEMFSKKRKEGKRAAFFMPSLSIFLLLTLLAFFMFDFSSVVFSSVSRPKTEEKQIKKKKLKREKKNIVEEEPKTFRDTLTYRAYNKIASLFRRAKSEEKQE